MLCYVKRGVNMAAQIVKFPESLDGFIIREITIISKDHWLLLGYYPDRGQGCDDHAWSHFNPLTGTEIGS